MVGTTIRAADQVPGAFRDAFAKLGVDLSDVEIQSMRGRSKYEAISEFMQHHFPAGHSKPDTDSVYEDFRADRQLGRQSGRDRAVDFPTAQAAGRDGLLRRDGLTRAGRLPPY